jgi:acetyltransferase-like isoleucine patch superfamily enzyme
MRALWIRFAKAILSLPICCLVWVHRMGFFGFATGSCALALVPGSVGHWWRRCWYQRTLESCGENLMANWMSVIFMPDTRVGSNVHLGPFSSVIEAQIGDNVMLGTNVAVARGTRQHGFARLDIPMNLQASELKKPIIGDDCWIGTAAVILADVASGSVVGAGAVVTKTFAPRTVLAGVPARVIRNRGTMPEGKSGKETGPGW